MYTILYISFLYSTLQHPQKTTQNQTNQQNRDPDPELQPRARPRTPTPTTIPTRTREDALFLCTGMYVFLVIYRSYQSLLLSHIQICMRGRYLGQWWYTYRHQRQYWILLSWRWNRFISDLGFKGPLLKQTVVWLNKQYVRMDEWMDADVVPTSRGGMYTSAPLLSGALSVPHHNHAKLPLCQKSRKSLALSQVSSGLRPNLKWIGPIGLCNTHFPCNNKICRCQEGYGYHGYIAPPYTFVWHGTWQPCYLHSTQPERIYYHSSDPDFGYVEENDVANLILSLGLLRTTGDL